MSEPLFKVRFNTPRSDIMSVAKRVLLDVEIKRWLTKRSRLHHLITVYFNDDDITAVLNDRDTALMLKLALA